MAIGGICQSCGMFSPGLYTCKFCGARCCPNCIDSKTLVCKLCGGKKQINKIGKVVVK